MLDKKDTRPKVTWLTDTRHKTNGHKTKRYETQDTGPETDRCFVPEPLPGIGCVNPDVVYDIDLIHNSLTFNLSPFTFTHLFSIKGVGWVGCFLSSTIMSPCPDFRRDELRSSTIMMFMWNAINIPPLWGSTNVWPRWDAINMALRWSFDPIGNVSMVGCLRSATIPIAIGTALCACSIIRLPPPPKVGARCLCLSFCLILCLRLNISYFSPGGPCLLSGILMG